MLKDKALENLAAGESLLALGFVNAAASRYYYALYQGAVHMLTKLGFRPGEIRSGALEWDHSMVLNNTRVLRGEWRDRLLFTEMRWCRSEADYGDDSVERSYLEARRKTIAEVVKEIAK